MIEPIILTQRSRVAEKQSGLEGLDDEVLTQRHRGTEKEIEIWLNEWA